MRVCTCVRVTSECVWVCTCARAFSPLLFPSFFLFSNFLGGKILPATDFQFDRSFDRPPTREPLWPLCRMYFRMFVVPCFHPFRESLFLDRQKEKEELASTRFSFRSAIPFVFSFLFFSFFFLSKGAHLSFFFICGHRQWTTLHLALASFLTHTSYAVPPIHTHVKRERER